MMKPLADSFSPGKYDVIVLSGASRKRSRPQHQHQCKTHEGNTRYLIVLNAALAKYSRAQTKFQKWHLANEIATSIRRVNPQGGFVARDDVTGQWYQIGDKMSVEIVRENLHSMLERRQRRQRQARLQATNKIQRTPQPCVGGVPSTTITMAPPPRRVSIEF